MQLSKMLFQRFLFSALVDADWSSSAEHFEPDYLAQHTGPDLNPEAALQRLLDIRREKQQGSTASPALNHMRDELFDACLVAVNEEPGLFTLTAPTGLGKTLALLAFALRHCQHWGKRRVVLVLPYLTLIKQNCKDYRAVIPDLLELHSNVHWTEAEQLLAQRWDAPCIVTTNVSFFEPLFSSQPGQCRHLHQLANSVIVLDEAQSLPPRLLDATLRTVKLLCDHYGCTVLAPLDSLIQAAGRCNRNGDSPEGQMTVFLPDEERLYPTEDYGRGAQAVIDLLSRHEIDCNDLSHIDEYYQSLYQNDRGDKKELREAIQKEDYPETERQYQIIDQAGVQIIVPYAGQLELYEEICRQLDRDGLTSQILQMAKELTVSCYDKKAVRKNCVPLFHRSYEAGQEVPTKYYLLGIHDFYSEKQGLHFEGLFDGIF